MLKSLFTKLRKASTTSVFYIDINFGRIQLPPELWALVLCQLEDVWDFAHAQLVSRSFQTLVLRNCWTKIRRIAIKQNIEPGNKEWVVVLETTVPGAELQLPAYKFAWVLVKIVEKASKVTAVSLDFTQSRKDKRIEVMQRFLYALVAAKVKVQEFELRAGDDQWPLSHALAKFLSANSQSLTTLKVGGMWFHNISFPAELHRAFQKCHALEKMEITRCCPWVVESVLQGRSGLISLTFHSDVLPATFLKSGATLRHFSCRTSEPLEAYMKQVARQNRWFNHPLRSLKELEIEKVGFMLPDTWALFPNLELLISTSVTTEQMQKLVKSFLMCWMDHQEKALVWRVQKFWRRDGKNLASSKDIMKVATAVKSASGCRVVLHLGFQKSLLFCKGGVTVNVIIHEALQYQLHIELT